MATSTVPQRGQAVVHELADPEQTVLFDQGKRRLLVLNDLGAAIWYLIDGARAVEQIAELISEQLQVEKTVALRDTEVFLADLEERGLVTLERTG